MSGKEESDILNLIQAARKVDSKWNIAKIAAFLGGVFYLGSVKGDWYQWRDYVDKDREEVRSVINNLSPILKKHMEREGNIDDIEQFKNPNKNQK